MSNLITVQEFISFRDVSKKVDEDKINESISLAQKSDLYAVLKNFYFDVLKNKDSVDYQELMNGSSFEYCGNFYIHDGLKAVLADFAYARYVYSINQNFTPFGLTRKKSDNSEAIDFKTTSHLSNLAQQDANNKFKVVQKYILSKPNLFSRYCENQVTDTSFNSLKINKI